MIAAAVALILLGILLLFLFPWGGIAADIAGVILVVLYLAGFGRRAAQSRP